MEISSFPFLSFEDFSQFYSTPYPELEPSVAGIIPAVKRRRISDYDFTASPTPIDDDIIVPTTSPSTLKEILASLLMADDDETEDQEALNQLPEVKSMNNYYQQQQFQNPNYTNFSDCDADGEISESKFSDSAQRNAKRSRTSTSGPTEGSSSGPTGRRLWVKNRSKDWWEKCSHPDYPNEEFKRDFRMSKSTFEMICNELDPIITKKDTMLRAAIPVRQRVAVCIWRLATGEPLRLVSKRFGLGISTCHKLVLEVCSAIKTALMPKFLQWPDETRMGRIKSEFESISGIPNVGGSMYTTHIPIIAPKTSVAAYYNKRHTERSQKTSYSITVQGVVDPNGVFTDVCIGWPGSLPDEQVLEKSALHQRASHGVLKNVWIVGTTSFPLMDWVLVPYTQTNRTWTQHGFNEKIEEIQKTARGAFSRLKGRWGCLQKRTEVKLQDLPVVLGACCVLHNICEMRNESMGSELEPRFELFDDEMVPENGVRSVAAVQARDHIAHNLLHHRPAGISFF